MKKIIYVFLAIMLTSSLCFAQVKTPIAKTKTVKTPLAVKVFNGKIAKIISPDLPKKIWPQIVVINNARATQTFQVRSSSLLYNKVGKPITFNKLAPRQNVKINYVTYIGGANKAVSVYLQ